MKLRRMLAILLCLAFCLSLPALAANTPVRVVESNGIFTVINDSGNDYEVTAFFAAYSNEGQLCGVELVSGFTRLPAWGVYSATPGITGDRVKLVVLEAGTYLPITGEPLPIEKLASDELTDIAVQTLDAVADYVSAKPDGTGYSITALNGSATAGQVFTDLMAALVSAAESCPALGTYCINGYAVSGASDGEVRACLAASNLCDTEGNPVVFSTPLTELNGKTVTVTLFSGIDTRYDYLMNFRVAENVTPVRGIAGMAFNEAGELVVTYTDGTTENLGRIPGTGGNTEPEEPDEPDVPEEPEEPDDDDEAEITYTEAVNVMENLGIIPGYSDGSFRPKGTVTRVQVAKILAYMMLGAANAEHLPAPTSQLFTDVTNNHWAAKYIGYCAAMGVIPDDGDGYFLPNNPITGMQLARMLLLALGYGKAGEYVGSGWDFKVYADALAAGIFVGSHAEDFNAPVTREECALYIYNTMVLSGLVTYDAEHNEYFVNTTTYAEKVWKLRIGTGILTANTAAGSNATQIIFDDGSMAAFAVDTGLDLIGHEVQVLYEDVRNDRGVYTNVYAVIDISTVIPAFSTIGRLIPAPTVNQIANYVITLDTAYIAPAPNSMTFNDLIVYNDRIIGYIVPEVFSIAQVVRVDAKTGAYTLDDGTVTDRTWTLCGAAKGDYIEVVQVGANTITRPTSRVENVQVTQIRNASAFQPTSYNNGQFVQSGASNVGDYLNQAASNLVLGSYYNFYLDTKGKFFCAEFYSAPAQEREKVFFVKAFTIAGTTTIDEWGQTIAGKTTYYAQCVTAAGEMVNYETRTWYDGYRGVVELAFDSKGYAELSLSGGVVVMSGGDYRNPTTQFRDGEYRLTEDANIIELSAKNARQGAAELGNLKVTTTTGFVQGDYTDVYLYVVLTNNGTSTWDVPTVWIDGAAKPYVEPVLPVPASYIYVTDTTQVGQMLINNRTYNIYSVYIDGEKKEIVLSAAPYQTGFYAYTVKDDVYTLSAVSDGTVRSFILDGVNTLVQNSVLSSTEPDLDGKSITGLKVVDLRLVAPASMISDVAGLERLTEPVTLTVLMTDTGAFTGSVIYVS